MRVLFTCLHRRAAAAQQGLQQQTSRGTRNQVMLGAPAPVEMMVAPGEVAVRTGGEEAATGKV